MKTLKCPLCGKELRLKWCPTMHYRVWCNYCYWETSNDRGAPEIAWKDAKEFIFKFPPIMRLNQGDMLKFFNHQMRHKIASIEKVNLKAGWIKTNKGFARPDDVILWPWELKQEGGDNGR